MTSDEATKLKTARANYVEQLLELSDPDRRKLSYSIGGRSISWTDYQRYLLDAIKGIDETLRMSGHDGPECGYIVTAME